MKKEILAFIKENKLELLITLCIFSNLYPYTFPKFLYYIGLALVGYKMMKCNVHFVSRNSIYIVFLGMIFLSSLLNVALDLRLVLFTGILVLGGPFVTSVRWHLYKMKLARCFFIGFALTVVVSLIAKALGVNYQVSHNFGGASMTMYGGYDEFSGFAKFPMWNSAAAAISILFFAYKLFNDKLFKSKYKWFNLAFFLSSIYICLISSSRSAFAFSMVCVGLLFLWLLSNSQSLVRYAAILGMALLILLPFFTESATRMLQKQQQQERTGVTSRDELWAKREAEFLSSPIYGVGFAVNGVGLHRKIGRDESGGSWFAILAQTGLLGFSIALILWFKTFTSPSNLRFYGHYLLIYATVCFFTLHSIVEGYMFQGGWYMCFICWMFVGLLNEAQLYKRQLIAIYKY